MMAKNSCSLISPSWSRSNSSIMACLFHLMSDRHEKLRVNTHSSSSSSRSPISFATRRRFRNEILPVLSSSNSWNARRISSIGSLANMRSLTVKGHQYGALTADEQIMGASTCTFKTREDTRILTNLRKVLELHQMLSSFVMISQYL